MLAAEGASKPTLTRTRTGTPWCSQAEPLKASCGHCGVARRGADLWRRGAPATAVIRGATCFGEGSTKSGQVPESARVGKSKP